MSFALDQLAAISIAILLFLAGGADSFTPPHSSRQGSLPHRKDASFSLRTAGADIEQETEQPFPPISSDTGDGASEGVPFANRGKVNEIDFCIAPADVSLSRSYSTSADASTSDKSLSLTRALNNASNRVVRRILLARSWPSAEALNLSLRQVLAAERDNNSREAAKERVTTAKCPVPRPILNILVRRRGDSETVGQKPMPRKSRTDEEYVADQLAAFRERYSTIPGFPLAEAYLECILRLATSGVESPRVSEVIEAGIYDESYRRVVAVLKSVGTVFEKVPGNARLRRIAPKLVNQDICLSMLDKMNMKRDLMKVETPPQTVNASATIDSDKQAESKAIEKNSSNATEAKNADKSDPKFRPLKLLLRGSDSSEEEEFELDHDDLGGVLLSAEEPSMTRQLNVLSNIVLRALLFGGDQELLVLSETLDADKPAFVQRWYPGRDGEIELFSPEEETRPGVQYLDCLSYSNAYERLMASLVELGSGYIKPVSDIMTMPKPRTAQEELGRFAVWESAFRSKQNATSYPEDLEGSWEVKDEIGGKTIGVSTVFFRPNGQVEVAPPMQGLRWRLDPGPTHLDTCTFQVLGDDGTILQYRGFIDRGARLEARFSRRPMRIRGSVMFQMRDGDGALLGSDYWNDMLPINYKTGTTKFVMTQNS
mmetsp:Transcript_28559/g.51717  ORF Transcript_28559/g.51717 Transcript_28559/m.51717 type:complete len:656 (+) Transcript_28559:57-2024(+)